MSFVGVVPTKDIGWKSRNSRIRSCTFTGFLPAAW